MSMSSSEAPPTLFFRTMAFQNIWGDGYSQCPAAPAAPLPSGPALGMVLFTRSVSRLTACPGAIACKVEPSGMLFVGLSPASPPCLPTQRFRESSLTGHSGPDEAGEEFYNSPKKNQVEKKKNCSNGQKYPADE